MYTVSIPYVYPSVIIIIIIIITIIIINIDTVSIPYVYSIDTVSFISLALLRYS